MPYDEDYTYVNAASELSYAYGYSYSFGWRWLPSPWVFGVGPELHWGAAGRVRFAWYAQPWLHDRGGAHHDSAYRGPAFAHSGGEHYFHDGSAFHGGGGGIAEAHGTRSARVEA
jgi:hypothetical protein